MKYGWGEWDEGEFRYLGEFFVIVVYFLETKVFEFK